MKVETFESEAKWLSPGGDADRPKHEPADSCSEKEQSRLWP